MRNWLIRSQIILVLVLPLLGLAGFGAWVVAGQLAAQRASEQTRTAARWLVDVNDLVHALQAERYAVSSLVGSSYRAGEFVEQASTAATEVEAAYERVSAGAATLPEDSRHRVQDLVATAHEKMQARGELRTAVDQQTLRPGPGSVAYTEMIHAWLNAGASLTGVGSEDSELVRVATALSAISWTAEEVSQQYGYLSAAIVLGSVVPDSAIRVQAAIGGEAARLNQFRATATPEQIALYEQVVTPPAQQVAALRDQVLAGDAGQVSFTQWASVSGDKQNALRTVEARIVADLESRSSELASAAGRRALLTALLVAVVVAVSAAVSVMVAARLVGALRALQAGALRVAQQRLPEVTATLRGGHAIDPATEPPAFADPPRNEIGDVARACNTLYGAAVAATYEVAESRSISDVLRTLARRSLTLTRRQLQLISALEQSEEDPKTVEMLFGVDHQATRMRRLAESLLVLAGEQPHRRHRDSAPLHDVLRAAASEVEDYTRVKITATGADVQVAGPAVGDLTHLLAELLENATAYSPAGTPVEVRASQVGQGWAVEIEDRGVGLPPETMEKINARLADPPPFEPQVGGQIGLVVVARLAARHQISVQMRRGVYGGVHVVVILPSTVLQTARNRPALAPVGAGEPALAERGRNGDRPGRADRAGRAEPAERVENTGESRPVVLGDRRHRRKQAPRTDDGRPFEHTTDRRPAPPAAASSISTAPAAPADTGGLVLGPATGGMRLGAGMDQGPGAPAAAAAQAGPRTSGTPAAQNRAPMSDPATGGVRRRRIQLTEQVGPAGTSPLDVPLGPADPLFGDVASWIRGDHGMGPAVSPHLPRLPQRVRGAHLAENLRSDPGSAPLSSSTASAPNPDEARRLAESFMSGYARGQKASGNHGR